LAMQEEIADLTMVIIHLAQQYGICYSSFMDAIIAKHNVNRNRTWIKQPDGSWKHFEKKPDIGSNYQDPHIAI